jgi:hypothetical protein
MFDESETKPDLTTKCKLFDAIDILERWENAGPLIN